MRIIVKSKRSPFWYLLTTEGVVNSTFIVFVCFLNFTSDVYNRLSPRLSLASMPSDLVYYILLYYLSGMYTLLFSPTELRKFCPLINTFRMGPFLLLLKFSLPSSYELVCVYSTYIHWLRCIQEREIKRETGREGV